QEALGGRQHRGRRPQGKTRGAERRGDAARRSDGKLGLRRRRDCRMILRSSARACGCAWLALALIACSPITANTAYTPRTSPGAPLPKPACRMSVVEIADDRMDPSVLGAVAGRTVRAPSDMQAWMRSVIGGLDRSGIAVEFDDQGAAGRSGLVAKAE